MPDHDPAERSDRPGPPRYSEARERARSAAHGRGRFALAIRKWSSPGALASKTVNELAAWSDSDGASGRSNGLGPDVLQHLDELEAYLRVLEAMRHRAISLEIGFFRGGTYFAWTRLFDQVVSIELDPASCRWGRGEFATRRSQLICGDSRSAATRNAVSLLLGGRLVDHLFVDGDHRLPAVRDDFSYYAPFVRTGGIIGFHDPDLPEAGVEAFLEQLRSGRVNGWPPIHTERISYHPEYPMGIAFFRVPALT